MGSAHQFVDPQGESRRFLIALDGRVKVALLLAALIVNLTAGGVRAPLLLAAVAYASLLASGVRSAPFLKRMAVPAMLAVVAFGAQLFWVQEGPELLRVPFGEWEAVIYQGGVNRGLALAARIIGGMAVLLFFSLSTPLPELMRTARYFRCPAVLVELALIMYRYIFLLLEEGGRIRFAEKARLGFVDFRASLRSSGILGGMLVLRTYDRAERSFAAMRCRGYRGALTAVIPGKLQAPDWTGLVGGLLVLGILWATA